MEIRKILVPLSGRFDVDDPENLDAPALKASLQMARHLGARIDVLCVTGPVAPHASDWLSWVPDYGMDAVLHAMEKQGAVRRRHAQKSFETIVESRRDAGDFSAAFVERAGDIGGPAWSPEAR